MATHPRDGKKEVALVASPEAKAEKDPRIPLKEVAFRELTKIPGSSSMMTVLTAGERRVVDGKEWFPPPMWLDPVRREICILDRRYPLERVHYYDRLTAALTKTPPPLDLSQWTVGKKSV